ncbi:serine/threonine-protein kinase [Nannocystaceae bacterium ST9]
MTKPLDALVGEVLDERYRIDSLLGQGGMGAVFKATHVGLKREVAIKVLHPEIGNDGQIAKRFEREAHSASRLDHPHCVRVTDFGATAEGMKYLVMELLVGCELTKRLGKPWAWPDAVAIVEQVLEALVHAHHHGIVHRDLKPENVFLARDFKGEEVAKIVDFGIAKLLDGEGGGKEALTRAGMVFGTPRYMSPEQAAGGKVDERTDLYALGIILFEMLTGNAPFDADELPTLLRMQIMAPPPPLPASVPAELAAFVGKLLEKSRHDRPESASKALIELREIEARLGQQVANTVPPMGDGIPAAIPADVRSLVGTVLAGHFRIDAMLGEGGMGAVFRARHLLMDRDVAIKVLHPELARDPEISARFDREAQTAARLEHPNIVAVLEFGGTPAGFRYLVMPLLAGCELRQLTGQPMPPARAIWLAIQIFAALEHAHARAVVHRDLKPENVFVIRGEQGREQLKLVDFGLAKLAEGASTGPALTRIGQVFGTPAYMSPEQARGEVVDARTDLYSAGLILYELLAGRLPFVDPDVVALLQRQIHEPPPALPESIDARLRELVMRLLAKDRELRPPDASSVKQMLETLEPGSLATMATLADMSGVGSRPATSSMNSLSSMNSMNSMNSMGSIANGATPGPSMARQLFDSIPRKWLYVAAGVLALLVVIAAWPDSANEGDEGDDAGDDATPAVGRDPGGRSLAVPLPFGGSAKPGEDVYIEIDRLLSAKSRDAALAKIRVARDSFPADAGLLWREGKALAQSKAKPDRQTALERYGEAVDADPTLVDDTAFNSELYGLLHEPALREMAIDLAVQKLGAPAHAFLLELLNVEDPKQALGWVDRHRILDALSTRPESLARVDAQLNLARDVYQAKDAPQPCTAFANTLDAVEARNEPYFVEHTTSKAVVIPSVPGPGEDASECAGLAERYAALGSSLSTAYPEEAARVEKARKSRKKGGGGGGGGFWPF